ncbi:hypothetical protein Tco_0766345, partial [Tanacetum coccineum]
TEASIRRHLKLNDSACLPNLPNAETFEQLARMETFPTPILIKKVFSNMKRPSKGCFGIVTPLFDSMLSLPQEEAALTPHESPLQSVHSLRRDEGSLSLHELTLLCTTISNKVVGLESELKQTKETYNAALTKLIKKVERLEQTVKISKPRRRARIKASDDTKLVLQEDAPTKLVEDQCSGKKGQPEVTTADTGVNTASATQPPKKLKKRVQVQMSIDEDLAKKVHEEEQAKAMAEQEQERKILEAALELQRQLDEREEVPTKATQAPKIKRKGQEVLEEPVETQETKTEQVEIEASKKEGGRKKKSLARKRGRESVSKESSKKQKLEDDAEKEELQGYLNIVSEDEGLDVESLATKYPIGDWETQILGNKYYYHIKRADGSIKHYNLFSAMLYDFDRQDGDLKTMMEPNAEDEIWRNQQDWNLIQWKLHNFCGIHVILMDTGLVIHMMVERKYPLLQDVLSMMLQRRLEVDYQSEMSYELIRKAYLLEDKQIPSIGVFDEVSFYTLFRALGCHLEEIHVTWDHLEKKRTRLRTYTKSLKKSCIRIVETASRASSDAIMIYQVTASEF